MIYAAWLDTSAGNASISTAVVTALKLRMVFPPS
jgi:hypothetical protein